MLVVLLIEHLSMCSINKSTWSWLVNLQNKTKNFVFVDTISVNRMTNRTFTSFFVNNRMTSTLIKSSTHKLRRVCKFFPQILWIFGKFCEIMWNFDEFCEILVNFVKFWWILRTFVKVWWILANLVKFWRIWLNFDKFGEILVNVVKFWRIWWNWVGLG